MIGHPLGPVATHFFFSCPSFLKVGFFPLPLSHRPLGRRLAPPPWPCEGQPPTSSFYSCSASRHAAMNPESAQADIEKASRRKSRRLSVPEALAPNTPIVAPIWLSFRNGWVRPDRGRTGALFKSGHQGGGWFHRRRHDPDLRRFSTARPAYLVRDNDVRTANRVMETHCAWRRRLLPCLASDRPLPAGRSLL